MNENGHIDDRGPCGCHLNPSLSQHARTQNPRRMKEWCDAVEEAAGEAEEEFAEHERGILRQPVRWSGEVERQVAVLGNAGPAPSKPAALVKAGGRVPGSIPASEIDNFGCPYVES